MVNWEANAAGPVLMVMNPPKSLVAMVVPGLHPSVFLRQTTVLEVTSVALENLMSLVTGFNPYRMDTRVKAMDHASPRMLRQEHG